MTSIGEVEQWSGRWRWERQGSQEASLGQCAMNYLFASASSPAEEEMLWKFKWRVDVEVEMVVVACCNHRGWGARNKLYFNCATLELKMRRLASGSGFRTCLVLILDWHTFFWQPSNLQRFTGRIRNEFKARLKSFPKRPLRMRRVSPISLFTCIDNLHYVCPLYMYSTTCVFIWAYIVCKLVLYYLHTMLTQSIVLVPPLECILEPLWFLAFHIID